MATKGKSTDLPLGDATSDQFVFVEVPPPSNDNSGAAASADMSSVSPNVLFMVGEYIFDFDSTDTANALIVALDGAETDAAEYAAFSSSVMFVFGDAIEA